MIKSPSCKVTAEENTSKKRRHINEALSGVWGTRAFFSGEHGNKGLKKKGYRETQAILGNREHRKSRFCLEGTREQCHFSSGTREQVPTHPGRASLTEEIPGSLVIIAIYTTL